MIDLYVALIINGRRTIDKVPERYKDAVLADLNALGLDGYGNPLGEQRMYSDEDIYITSDTPLTLDDIDRLESTGTAACVNCTHWHSGINCEEYGYCGALYGSEVFTRADFHCQWFEKRGDM